MALSLCGLIEQWITKRPKLKDLRIVPIVRINGDDIMGDIMLWLPDLQRFPVGYIHNDYIDVFIPGETIQGGDWTIIYAYNPNFLKDLEKLLLLIINRWKSHSPK